MEEALFMKLRMKESMEMFMMDDVDEAGIRITFNATCWTVSGGGWKENG